MNPTVFVSEPDDCPRRSFGRLTLPRWKIREKIVVVTTRRQHLEDTVQPGSEGRRGPCCNLSFVRVTTLSLKGVFVTFVMYKVKNGITL